MAEGGVTPQRNLQSRDMNQRGQAFGDYAEYERLNLGHGNQLSREVQALDREFFDEQHYDARLSHQMDDAAFSERNRMIEITGPFIDQTMERYLGKIAQVENARIERKHGQGRLGRVRRWFSDTEAGSRVHYGGKVALGFLAHGLSIAAPIAAPALNFIGARMIADGFVEAIQKEGFEIPRIQRLEQLRLGRHYWIRELARLRNLYSGQSPIGDPYGRVDIVGTPLPAPTIGATIADVAAPGVAPAMDSGALNSAQENHMAYPGPTGAPSAEYANPATNLNRRLEIIIEQAELFEVQIQRTEQELENIRRIGRTIRGVVGAAISAVTIYELFTNGLSMGIQNFDSAVEAAKGLVPTPHEVFLTGNGVQFAYNTADEINAAISAGATVGNIGGLAMHSVGTVAPWLQIGVTVGGLVGSMAGSLAMDINAVRAHNANYHRLEEERNNQDDQAVLSFTGRTTNDFDNIGASGVHHEIEHVSSMSTVRNSEEMNERKEIMVPGSVWRINRVHLPVGVVPPANVLTAGPNEVLYQVIRWEGQGLVYTFVANDSVSNLKDGIVVGPRVTSKDADDIIMNSRMETDNVLSLTPTARIDGILRERGVDIITNNNRVVKSPITIGGVTIPAGHFIETSRPSPDRIVVKTYSDAITLTHSIDITDSNLADLTTLLENTDIITTRKEFEKNKIKEANKAALNQINTIVKDHLASRNKYDLTPGQLYSVGPTDWMIIGSINDEVPGGQITVTRRGVGADDFPTIDALPPKDKPKRIARMVSDGLVDDEPFTFAAFRSFVEDKGGGATYVNRMIFQPIKP